MGGFNQAIRESILINKSYLTMATLKTITSFILLALCYEDAYKTCKPNFRSLWLIFMLVHDIC